MKTRKFSLRAAALLLTLAEILLLLGCAGGGGERSADENGRISSETSLEFDLGTTVLSDDAKAKDGRALEFRVVRNDLSDKFTTNLAVLVRDALKAVFDTHAVLVTDFTNRKDNANIREIVVGKTNRAMSYDYPTGEDDWAIYADGNKIFICGQSDGALNEAVTTFVCDVLGYRSADDFDRKEALMFSKSYMREVHYIDPEKVQDDGQPKVLFGLSQDQAGELFSDILDGLFTGATRETLDPTPMGKAFNMHFPDMLYVNGEYWAYYICYKTKNGKGGVGLAKSTDGVNFTDCGCVVQPDEPYDCNGAYFAGVTYDEESELYYMVYECKGDKESEYTDLENVAWAISADGIEWDKQGVLIYKNPRLEWQTANVGTPDLFRADGKWYVTFHGFDYKTCQIGVAYGDDLNQLTVLPEPVIPTVPETLYSGTTGRRDIIYVGGYYYMVYEVSTEQPYKTAYWTHMFARSTDMIHWETIPMPLVRQTTGDGEFKTGMGYDGPCWLIYRKHIYVYFRGSGNCTYRAELTLK